MRLSPLLVLAGAYLQSAMAKATVPKGDPALRIYLDADSLAHKGNPKCCTNLATQRRTCYLAGVNAKNLKAEHECLCSDVTAKAAVNCFASSYSTITNSTAKALYYQSFLNYLYDCYCGVKPVDVSIDATTKMSYIKGLDGSPILPPDGGCPAVVSTSTAASTPPCGCSPPDNTVWTPCPAGQSSVNGYCVADPVAPAPCYEPNTLVGQNCVCERPNIIKDGKCTEPQCPGDLKPCSDPKARCVCPAGTEPAPGQYKCQPICKAGTRRNSAGVCVDVCAGKNKAEPWTASPDGTTCVCPWPYVVRSDGKCGYVDCTAPEVADPANPGTCICPCPNVKKPDGTCGKPDVVKCTVANTVLDTYTNTCVCLKPNYFQPDGTCAQKTCVSPEVKDSNEDICRCPFPLVYNAAGVCGAITCGAHQYLDPYNYGCSCSWPWVAKAGDTSTCECVAPNTVDSSGDCVEPVYTEPDTGYDISSTPVQSSTYPAESSTYPAESSSTYIDPITYGTPSPESSYTPESTYSPTQYSYTEPETTPTYTAPAYTEPTYTEPTYTEPTYAEPTYTAPTQPAYTAPAYTAPAPDTYTGLPYSARYARYPRAAWFDM